MEALPWLRSQLGDDAPAVAAIIDPPWGGLDYKKKQRQETAEAVAAVAVDPRHSEGSGGGRGIGGGGGEAAAGGGGGGGKSGGRSDGSGSGGLRFGGALLSAAVARVAGAIGPRLVLGLKLPLSFDVSRFVDELRIEQRGLLHPRNDDTSGDGSGGRLGGGGACRVASVKKFGRQLFLVLDFFIDGE